MWFHSYSAASENDQGAPGKREIRDKQVAIAVEIAVIGLAKVSIADGALKWRLRLYPPD